MEWIKAFAPTLIFVVIIGGVLWVFMAWYFGLGWM